MKKGKQRGHDALRCEAANKQKRPAHALPLPRTHFIFYLTTILVPAEVVRQHLLRWDKMVGEGLRNPASAIATAIERRPKMLPLRATFESINARAFADNNQLQKIDNSNWQILFGRRGAGKTTLLATYANYITKELSAASKASIELNVTDFMSVIDNGSSRQISDIEVAQIYFSDFMERICMHLFNVFTKNDQRSKFVRVFLASPKQGYIQDLVLRLVDSIKIPIATEIGAHRKESLKTTFKASVQSKRGIGLTADATASTTGAPKGSIKASIELGAKSVENDESKQDAFVGFTHFKFDYFKTRDAMIDLLEALNIETLYIFIDEWPELDRSSTRNIQPFFAELLKKVFWNNERFVIKLGAVRNQTKLITRIKDFGPIGLEPGADIFEIDLDEAYSNPALNKVKFYEELLFKHLWYCNPDLEGFRQSQPDDFYGTQIMRPVETFVTYIFKSHKEFETLIEGAGGLPRDFVEMFDSLARSKGFSVEPTWNMKDVKSCVREHCVKTKQSDIGDDAYEAFDGIIKLIKANNSRLILVKRRSNRKLLSVVGEFYHKRLLHDVPLLSIPVLIRPQYHMYYADLGLLYDASARHMDEASEGGDHPEFSSGDGPAELKKYILSSDARRTK
jgi:hypothetical protein